MNVLVVDDQQDVVKGVVGAINWEELTVDNVLTANSMAEAMLVFRDMPVDILVTDIEMPLGSGIDLVRWVRDEHPGTECIFLTSHEDFSYARAALQLGSFDYLLQPIKYDELKRVLVDAIAKVRSRSQIEEYYTYGKYWEQNTEQLRETFWFQVLTGGYQQNKARLDLIARQLDISQTDPAEYRPFMISILRRQVQLSEWDDDLLKHTFANILAETIVGCEGLLQIVPMDASHYIGLLPLTAEGPVDEGQLTLKLQFFIDFCEQYLKSSMSCYIGNYASPSQLPEVYRQLQALEKDNVARYPKVFLLGGGETSQAAPLDIPEMKCWLQLLESGESGQVVTDIEDYVRRQVAAGVVNTQYLSRFQNELMEPVWNLAKERGVKIQEALTDPVIVDSYLHSLDSIEEFLAFIRQVVTIPDRQTMSEQDFLTAVEQVKAFIRENLDRELSRNEIAEKVYLNPEYLSRLFRKHTGITLSDFITHERIRTARDYLANTKMPVSIIASKTGYVNFSHFSKIFKKMTGLTPNEYRQSKQG